MEEAYHSISRCLESEVDETVEEGSLEVVGMVGLGEEGVLGSVGKGIAA